MEEQLAEGMMADEKWGSSMLTASVAAERGTLVMSAYLAKAAIIGSMTKLMRDSVLLVLFSSSRCYPCSRPSQTIRLLAFEFCDTGARTGARTGAAAAKAWALLTVSMLWVAFASMHAKHEDDSQHSGLRFHEYILNQVLRISKRIL